MFPVPNPLGGLLGEGLRAWQQDRTNADNRHAANAQMNYQSYMSNTAHQREVQDLIAAGLNPVLSAGGSGASTPGGASSTSEAGEMPEIAFPDIMQMASLQLDQQKVEIDRANSAAAIAKTLSDTDLNRMKKILAQKGMLKAELEGEASDIVMKFIKKMKGSKFSIPSFTDKPDIEVNPGDLIDPKFLGPFNRRKP